MSPDPRPAATHAPSLRDLFLQFLGIGISGFGGVLPWARRMMVEKQGWLTAGEFTDLLSLCQFLPGPNIVNMAVAVGARFQGVPGSLAALGGLLGGPVAIVIGLGAVYERYGQLPGVRNAFAGLAAAASGLVVAMALKIAWPLRSRPLGVGVAAVVIVCVAVFRFPLLWTMLALAPVSVLLAWALQR